MAKVEEEEDDPVAGLSERDVTDFIASPVWKLMKRELENRLATNGVLIESAPPISIFESGVLQTCSADRLMGDNTAVRHLLEYPAMILEEIRSRVEDKEEGKSND